MLAASTASPVPPPSGMNSNRSTAVPPSAARETPAPGVLAIQKTWPPSTAIPVGWSSLADTITIGPPAFGARATTPAS